MKRLHLKAYIVCMLTVVMSVSCDGILDEQPRSIYEPGFFTTEAGVEGGITSLYAHLRYLYGNGYLFNSGITGTDEATYAQSADGNFLVMDMSGRGNITPDANPAGGIWGTAFSNINTASGIIENAASVGLSDALIAEAEFFRAFDYFLLVQVFGGVPLDLGAGELAFNTNPVRTSVRNTVPEVYTKAIFPDLRKAVANLPEIPRRTGTVTKTVARYFLAKAYLTYAWWLENPNNIPTYPAADRVDPDGNNAAWYFQAAYDLAKAGIENPGVYGLMDTYYDVNWGPNDRNKEILLYADRTETSEQYNGSSLSYAGGGGPDNFAVWMLTWNYTRIRSSSSADEWVPISSVQREASQDLGRPWTRMAPTYEVITETFADKTNDSRYDGTFTTVYRGNWDKGGVEQDTLYNAHLLPVVPGDAILTFLDEDPGPNDPQVDYPDGAGNNDVGAGTLPGRADFVVAPSGISRIMYPGFWKLGTYRTDNNGGLGQPNGALTRPFNIAKFSELFLIAAEAAVKGANTSAISGEYANDGTTRGLVNVLRARAGKWRWDNGDNAERIEDNSAAMVAATPAVIDVDYILMERSREFYGEWFRWYDLVRTQKWNEFASSYHIGGVNNGDHTLIETTRTIEPYHYLRPIPQGQIDAMELSEEEKAAYQNPRY